MNSPTLRAELPTFKHLSMPWGSCCLCACLFLFCLSPVGISLPRVSTPLSKFCSLELYRVCAVSFPILLLGWPCWVSLFTCLWFVSLHCTRPFSLPPPPVSTVVFRMRCPARSTPACDLDPTDVLNVQISTQKSGWFLLTLGYCAGRGRAAQGLHSVAVSLDGTLWPGHIRHVLGAKE